ncbi:MAG TPA: hypothetical protein VMW69_16555 [Spirochaetia bacterium]|nr:hypothetical protein [Spirochaetia bacterium]
MKRRAIIVSISVILGLACISLLVYLVPRVSNTRFSFTFRDAVSKSWVWDATVTLQGKEIRSFYQSNKGPREYTFTGLHPGKATLHISAPYYVTVDLPIRLHIGSNSLKDPIEMVGYEIPGLTRFTMFESPSPTGLSIEIRPVNTEGHAVVDHPALNLWIGVLVSAETKDGRLVQNSVADGAARGEGLYRGRIAWTWDPSPAQNFRYHATLPYSVLSSHTTPYLVIDYLVIVPDPRKITDAEVNTMMQGAPDFTAAKQLTAYLEAKKGQDRFQYFFSTSWNVAGPGASS